MKHTPGPWHAEPTPSSDFVTRRIFGPNDEKICDVGVPRRSNVDVATEVANAGLIAAAPDLVEAAADAEALLIAAYGEPPAVRSPIAREHTPTRFRAWEVIDALRAALAKAEGCANG